GRRRGGPHYKSSETITPSSDKHELANAASSVVRQRSNSPVDERHGLNIGLLLQRRDPEERLVRLVHAEFLFELRLKEHPVQCSSVVRVGFWKTHFRVDVDFLAGQGIMIEQRRRLHTAANRRQNFGQRRFFDLDGEKFKEVG